VRDEFVIGAERKAAVVIKEMWLIDVYGLLLREIRKILRVGHFFVELMPEALVYWVYDEQSETLIPSISCVTEISQV